MLFTCISANHKTILTHDVYYLSSIKCIHITHFNVFFFKFEKQHAIQMIDASKLNVVFF